MTTETITYIYFTKAVQSLYDVAFITKQDEDESDEYWVYTDSDALDELQKVGLITDDDKQELSKKEVDVIIFYR